MSSSIVGNAGADFWLFNPATGYDLTHPRTPDGPVVFPRVKLSTTTMPVTIAPEKSAFIIIDMQNFFLSSGLRRRGPGHDAEEVLLSIAIPAARKAKIQVIHLTWGISEEELAVLPPVILRIFGYGETRGNVDNFEVQDISPGTEKEKQGSTGVGDDIGNIKLPDGSIVSGGRMLMRDQWNTALHDPLQKNFEESQGLTLPDVRFHKSRLSGFWGGSTPCLEFLKKRKITTLLFAGVNTDQCVLASLQDACNMGFDTILLKDGCGTTSPDYARQMVEYNCRKSWGFVSSCKALADGVNSEAERSI